MIENNQIKVHLAAAKTARASQDFKLVLEELAKALFFALQGVRGLSQITVGRASAQDALKLTAFGVSANDFLRLQEFLPMVSVVPASDWKFDVDGVLWKQSGFGHPANWRDEVADFCINTCLSVALSIQHAPPVPHPRPFRYVYDYKVTANKDDVEVWEDLVEEHLAHVYANNARPFRVPKRSLKRGESVTVSPHAQPFVSDDLSKGGELIKRVRISFEPVHLAFGNHPERAEFIDLADVTISCVPNEVYKHFHADLEEIPWAEDPLAYKL